MKSTLLWFLLAVLCVAACKEVGLTRKDNYSDSKMEKEIYLAGGCFWGTEHYFKQIEPVTIINYDQNLILQHCHMVYIIMRII